MMKELPISSARTASLRGWGIIASAALALALSHIPAQAQWRSVKPSGLAVNMYGVHFPTSQVGYATGWNEYGSVIVKTTDGGENWTGQVVNGALLFQPTFVTTEIGVIAGYLDACKCGMILRTGDGGESWQSGTNSSSFGFYSTSFPTPTTGYMSGYNGVILKTTDQGINWSTLETGTSNVFRQVVFPTADVGFAVAGKGTSFSQPTEIYKTTNGGESWALLHDFAGAKVIADIYFTSATVGFFVGSDGQEAIYKTVDGGASWERVSAGASTDVLQGISFADANNAIAVGSGGRILRTVDAGATWTPEQSGTTETLIEVSYTSGTAFAVGFNGLILKQTGTQASVPAVAVAAPSVSIAPLPVTSNATVEAASLTAGEHYSFVIYDIGGRELRRFEGTYDGSAFSFSRGDLASGVYMFRLVGERSAVTSGAFTVR